MSKPRNITAKDVGKRCILISAVYVDRNGEITRYGAPHIFEGVIEEIAPKTKMVAVRNLVGYRYWNVKDSIVIVEVLPTLKTKGKKP